MVVRVRPVVVPFYPAFRAKRHGALMTPMTLWIAVSYLSETKDLGLTPFL